MIQKIDINETSIVEGIRNKMATVTPSQNGLMPSSGFISRQTVTSTSDFNEFTSPGMHSIFNPSLGAANSPGFDFGVLCVFSAGSSYVLQVAVSVITGGAKIRVRTEATSGWKAWTTI